MQQEQTLIDQGLQVVQVLLLQEVLGVLVAVAGTEQNHRRRGCSAQVAFLNQGRL